MSTNRGSIVQHLRGAGLFFEGVGETTFGFVRGGLRFLYMLSDALFGIGHWWGGRGYYLRSETMTQFYHSAVRGFPLTLLVGLVLGVLVALPFASLGIDNAQIVATVYDSVVYHSLVPLVTAFIVTGRSGTAMTTELASFRIHQTVEGLAAMGIEPRRFLVLPRLIATILSLMAMTLWMSVGAVLASSVLLRIQMGTAIPEILAACFAELITWKLAITALMVVFFGTAIAGVHCYYGFPSRTPIAVARNAPQAFARSFSSCLVITFFFALARNG